MTRYVTDKEMRSLATPVIAAFNTFEDPHMVALAMLTLGLDIGIRDRALAARMSEVGQAIINGGEPLNSESLDATIGLASILFVLADADKSETVRAD